MGNYQRRCWLFAARENTGAHVLDSGGIYGRHYERNAKLTLDTAYSWAHRLEVGASWWSISLNVLHYLESNFTIDRTRTANFHKFAFSARMRNASWFECLQTFVEERGGRMGEGWNTYNGNSLLTQCVLTHCFRDAQDENWFAISVHTGCDVRGGYSRFFLCRQDECDWQVGEADAWISCGECHASWHTDDGCHWYGDEGGTLSEDDFEPFGDGLKCPICGGLVTAD